MIHSLRGLLVLMAVVTLVGMLVLGGWRSMRRGIRRPS